VLAGQGSFHFTASVTVVGYDAQGNPLWRTDGVFSNLTGAAQLSNLFDGSLWDLDVHIIQRDGQFTKYELDLSPL
jgi:hypothetical protein